MIKLNRGQISNYDGKTKDIIVKTMSPNKFKDILIGGGLTLLGITYLTVSAFKNGVEKYENAELKTMNELGLIEE